MDRRERSGDMGAALLAFGEGLQASLWTALPCILQTYDPGSKTCTAQPAIQAQVQGPGGEVRWVTLPVLLDVPVVFPGAKGSGLLSFPLQPGDEGLVIFSSRCIDAWWQLGCPPDANGKLQTQVQADLRMHDLSDGFFIPGGSSKPNVAPGLDPTWIELRSQDGAAKVRLHPTTHEVQVSTTGDVRVTGSANLIASVAGTAQVISQGDMTLTAPNIRIVGNLVVNNENYTVHKHSGVTTGSGQTGGKV